MNELVLNCHAAPNTRELSAAEIDTVGGGVGPLLFAGMLIDAFLVGFNIGMRTSITDSVLEVKDGEVKFHGQTIK